jgi:hypothetical protein
VQNDVAVIGLNCRANDLDDFFDLFTHSTSLWIHRPDATPEPANHLYRARLVS